MRKLTMALFCGLLAVAVTAATAADKAAEPLKILCVGDSITHGRGSGKEGDGKYFTSYRYPLWKKLLAAKVDFSLVGPKKGNLDKDCVFEKVDGKEFPNVHYAQFGIKAHEVDAKIAADIKGLDFNTVIMQLGTNDRGNEKPDQICGELASIIAKLRAEQPKVTVFLVGVPDNWQKALNPEMQKTAEKLNTADSPVVFVGSPKGWTAKPDLPNTDTLDWVHPNAQGNEKLAATIFAAMEKFFGWGK